MEGAVVKGHADGGRTQHAFIYAGPDTPSGRRTLDELLTRWSKSSGSEVLLVDFMYEMSAHDAEDLIEECCSATMLHDTIVQGTGRDRKVTVRVRRKASCITAALMALQPHKLPEAMVERLLRTLKEQWAADEALRAAERRECKLKRLRKLKCSVCGTRGDKADVVDSGFGGFKCMSCLTEEAQQAMLEAEYLGDMSDDCNCNEPGCEECGWYGYFGG